jgi:hypothetical protein
MMNIIKLIGVKQFLLTHSMRSKIMIIGLFNVNVNVKPLITFIGRDRDLGKTEDKRHEKQNQILKKNVIKFVHAYIRLLLTRT